MHPTTQPLLCCIGESVAGEPTQFLVERALQVTGLDWKVFTVEVALEQFQAAVAGMRAMRFSGVRFIGQWREKAVDEFAPGDAIAKFVGEVTSAKRTGSDWEAWHTLGFGVQSAVRSQLDDKNQIWLLVGESVTVRSTLAALAYAGPTPVQTVIWLNHQTPVPPELQAAWEALEITLVDLPTADDADWSHCEALLAEADASLVIVADMHGVSKRGQACIKNTDKQGLLLASEDVTSDKGADLSSVKLPAVIKRLKPADCIAAAETHDFVRWTGVAIDPQVLREAYEEFSAF